MLPVLYEGEVKAVLELASLYDFTPSQLAFLEQLTDSIGVVLNTIEATMRTEELLKQSQQLAGELQTQQRELQQTNEELATKARLLADQNVEVERKNTEIELARKALEEKAAELALTSRYKSEFLANMSHELRTPLNSILILGQQLSQNSEGNLQQSTGGLCAHHPLCRHGPAEPHHRHSRSVEDRVRNGHRRVRGASFGTLKETIERSFRHEAETRKLAFTLDFDSHLARSMTTDSKRLLQILKNLLSNAFKFTERGGVRLHVAAATGGWTLDHPSLNQSGTVVEFSVSDTGIGIPLEKQRIIFEAFQQADAGTARKYGGTGLGLAISRELAQLLGGEIRLSSSPGAGSTFTLYLPLAQTIMTHAKSAATGTVASPVAQTIMTPAVRATGARVEEIADDRDDIAPSDSVLLIVEDDPHYARVLLDLARHKGFKVLVAGSGERALSLAAKHKPTAISLDIFLPDMLGWTVLNQLKRNPETRHIPVQLLTVEDERQYGLERGAFSFVTKTITTESLEGALDRLKSFTAARPRRLLVVEDNAAERMSITELLGSRGHRDRHRRERQRRARAHAANARSIAWCSISRCPTSRGSICWRKCRRTPSFARRPSSSSPARELTLEEEGRVAAAG